MPRPSIPSWFFALVVVRHEGRFLLVQETRYDKAWSLPGGRVEPGEFLTTAAVRETREEAGVLVRLDGLLRLEHTPGARDARLRAVFAATPAGDPTPKQTADDESLGAAWFTLDEIAGLRLRGDEILAFLREVERGLPVLPLPQVGGELAM